MGGHRIGDGLRGAAGFGALGALLLLTQLGYVFEQYDQLQYLLLPYREIYPNFLPGDWFTWNTSHYHLTFSWLIQALHAVAGEAGFAGAVFATHLLTLWALAAAIWAWAAAGGRDRTASWRAAGLCVLAIAWVKPEGIAGATFQHGYLVPADMALPPLLMAFAVFQRGGRPFLTGTLLGGSAFLHANFAVLGPLVLGVAELSTLPGRLRAGARPTDALRSAAWMALGYLPLAAPTLWTVAQGFVGRDAHPEAVDVILRVRAPHHYAITLVDRAELWWALSWLTGAIAAWCLGKRRATTGRGRHVALGIAAVLLLGAVGAWLGSGPLVRLFCWRMSVPALCLCMFAVADALADRDADRPGKWLAVGVLAVAAAFVRSDLPWVAGLGTTPAWFAWPPALVLLVAACLRAAQAVPQRVRIAALPVACALCLGWSARALLQPQDERPRAGLMRKPRWTGPRVSELDLRPAPQRPKLRELHDYARLHTPLDSGFLIPPHMVEFRLAARRAVFVDFKAAPMRGDEALTWRTRMLEAMGTADFPATSYALRFAAGKHYGERPLRELVALAREKGLRYLVAPTQRKQARRARLIPRATAEEKSGPFPGKQRWTLYEVPDA